MFAKQRDDCGRGWFIIWNRVWSPSTQTTDRRSETEGEWRIIRVLENNLE